MARPIKDGLARNARVSWRVPSSYKDGLESLADADGEGTTANDLAVKALGEYLEKRKKTNGKSVKTDAEGEV